MESYPRQCQDNTGTYTEVITEQEEKGDGVIMKVTVAPERQRCVGTSPQECLVVDGLLFYDNIEGFEFEPGFEQTLQIERTLAFDVNNLMDIPADVSLYKFVLIDVLEKLPVSDTVICVVAGCSSQLCVSQEDLDNGGGVSTCEFREEYACYPAATCEVQVSGACGWTMTEELTQCLQNPPVLQ